MARSRAFKLSVRAGLIAILAVGLTATAAFAVFDYGISGDVPNKEGWGESTGEIDFPGSGGYTWIGRVRDRCPPDGAGMEVRVRVRFADGSSAWDNNVIEDLDGCGLAWRDETFPLWFRSNRNVTKVRVSLWATDDGQPYVRIARSREIFDPSG